MSPVRMSRIESAIRVVLAFNAAANRHDVAGMLRLISDDCVVETTHPAPEGTIYTGKAAIAQGWQECFLTSPHAHSTIEEIFGLGMRCVMRWRYEWVDMAGTKGHVRGVDIFHVKNDLICEQLSYSKR